MQLYLWTNSCCEEKTMTASAPCVWKWRHTFEKIALLSLLISTRWGVRDEGETKLKSARSNLWVHRPWGGKLIVECLGRGRRKAFNCWQTNSGPAGESRQHVAWHHFHRPVFHNPLLFNGARPRAFVTINLLEEAFHSQVIPNSLACLNKSILIGLQTPAYRHQADKLCSERKMFHQQQEDNGCMNLSKL